MRDIIVTWPKGRQLQSYLDELAKAERNELVINFRLPNPPKEAIPSANTVSCSFRGASKLPKCYMVYDGYIRGYNEILEIAHKGGRQVTDPVSGGFMRSGWYVVRHPKWYALDKLIPMTGFQGFRYFDEYRMQPK